MVNKSPEFAAEFVEQLLALRVENEKLSATNSHRFSPVSEKEEQVLSIVRQHKQTVGQQCEVLGCRVQKLKQQQVALRTFVINCKDNFRQAVEDVRTRYESEMRTRNDNKQEMLLTIQRLQKSAKNHEKHSVEQQYQHALELDEMLLLTNEANNRARLAQKERGSVGKLVHSQILCIQTH